MLLLLLTEWDGMEEGWQRALVSLPLLTRTLFSIVRAPFSQPHLTLSTFPKVLPPNTTTSGVRASTDEWQDHKHSFHTRGLNDNPIE